MLLSCDKVEEPYIKENVWAPTGRKVLLEDYTGHKCVNCPSAALTANELIEKYQDYLIVISIHAGYFAEPSSSGDYTYDFTCPVGNELNDYFEIVSNPSGMVNRKEYNENLLLGVDDWAGAVGVEINKYPDAEITIENIFNQQNRMLNTSIEIKFLLDMEGIYRLCAYITEDSIIAPQMNNDNNIGPVPDILDYVHKHVLRGSVNGTWGDVITNENITAESVFTLNYNDFEINSIWNEHNCSVIAFIYNEETKEIIQAEEKHIE